MCSCVPAGATSRAKSRPEFLPGHQYVLHDNGLLRWRKRNLLNPSKWAPIWSTWSFEDILNLLGIYVIFVEVPFFYTQIVYFFGLFLRRLGPGK